MKLVSYRKNIETEARVGIVYDDLVVDVQKLGEKINMALPSNMLDLIDCGLGVIKVISEKFQKLERADWILFSTAYSNVIILAPIPRPRKNIFCIGLNYTDHIAESVKSIGVSEELPQKCVIFSKPPTAVIGPFAPIQHNKNVTVQMDWEVELAIIIGKKATGVTKDSALDYVFGYTIINDISARDCRRSGQWFVSKGQDSYAPMGPYILTADELTDPHNLQIGTKINGIEKQNSNTRFMLFNVNAIIEGISEVISLESGDIIASGTPSGVGVGRNPQEFMWPGDVVEITIEKLGTLKNPIVNTAPF